MQDPEHLIFLIKNIGKPIRIWGEADSTGTLEGILINTPDYEHRSRFGVAYETGARTFRSLKGGSPYVKELDNGVVGPNEEIVGAEIGYKLIRPEKIVQVGLSLNDGKMILLRTNDINLLAGGGSLYKPQDITGYLEFINKINNGKKVELSSRV